MKTTLLLTIRSDCKTGLSVDVDMLLNNIISHEIETIVNTYDNHIIVFAIGKELVPVKYSYVKNQKTYILNIETERENVSSIKVMEMICTHISRSQYSRELNVIKAYDEPSQILASRIYRLLTRFERLLRKLVYEIVVKAYGSDWCKETLERFQHVQDFKSIYTDISTRSNQDNVNKIEVALEEMDYESLSKYLFSRKPLKSYAEILENDLSDEKISNMNRDEIVNAISKSRPKSLWEMLFQDYYDFNTLEKDMHIIHRLRNKVMHAKNLKYEEYQTLNKMLHKWIPLIEKAISDNEKEDYTPVQNINIIESLSILNGLFDSIITPWVEFSSYMSEKLCILSESVSDSILSSVSNVDFSSFSKNLLLLSELSEGVCSNCFSECNEDPDIK